ncbi:MobF family relaxase, partial [Williamsia muralis]|uniref:MobF family relaxase n=1 Tax=Williamsia marianensis TaxID=85044 RepID=UPI000DE723DE
MLTISKLDARSIDYYESELEQKEGRGLLDDGYYREGGDSVPEAWIAARLGEDESAVAAAAVGPGVKRGQLLEASETRAWLGECKSCDGERSLGRAPSEKSVRGFDLTFAAPKSVSMVWALGDDETRMKVESAVTEARQMALSYLAEHAGYSRLHDQEATDAKRAEMAAAGTLDLSEDATKGRGQVKRLVPVEGLSGAVYEHHESRTLDPHLHSHTLLSNRAFVAENQQWQTIDGTSLYNEAKSAGSIYQAALRSVLSRDLKVEWTAVDEATGMADLAGISREAIEAASTRHTEITEWAAKYLGQDPTAAQSTTFAQKMTRKTKNHQSAETMRESWEKSEWAKDVDLESILGSRSQTASASAFEGDWAGEILDGIARTESVFARRHVVVAVAARMPVTANADTLLAEIEARADEVMSDERMLTVSGDALQIESGERRPDEREAAQIFTSSAIVAQEMRFLDQAMEVSEDRVSSLSREDRAALLDSHSKMSEQQRAAVERTLDSGGLVTPIVAPAGAGKTSAIMVPLREAYEAEGRKVVGLTTAAAAGDVMRQEGAVNSARTVASMLRAIDAEAEGGKSAGWSARTVVMLDEAGMTGNADLARLTDYAKQSGAKIVTVGDWAQLGAVKARGGAFRLLCEDAPDVSDLRDEAHRQNDPEERAASLAVRDGSDREREAAAEWYTDNGRVESGSTTVMLDRCYDAWRADTAKGMDSLLLTATRDMANTLNTRAQHDQRADAWVALHGHEYGDEAQARAAFNELQPDVETVDVGGGGKVAVGEPLLTRENDWFNGAVLDNGDKA